MRKLFNYLHKDAKAFLDDVARIYRLSRYFEGLKDAVHMESCHDHNNSLNQGNSELQYKRSLKF